eukprot:SAG11_NODE_1825_length_4203_cov_3.238304_5_plen_170_part_00
MQHIRRATFLQSLAAVPLCVGRMTTGARLPAPEIHKMQPFTASTCALIARVTPATSACWRCTLDATVIPRWHPPYPHLHPPPPPPSLACCPPSSRTGTSSSCAPAHTPDSHTLQSLLPSTSRWPRAGRPVLSSPPCSVSFRGRGGGLTVLAPPGSNARIIECLGVGFEC